MIQIKSQENCLQTYILNLTIRINEYYKIKNVKNYAQTTVISTTKFQLNILN